MGPGESGNGKGETRNVMRRDAVRRFPFPASRFPALHGEGGIRTPDRGISPYNGLANRRLQPLGHLSTIARLNLAAGRTVRHPLLTGKTKPPRLRGLCPPERPRGLERNPERLVQ